MSQSAKFTIFIDPVAWQRPANTKWGKRMTPEKTRRFQDEVRYQASLIIKSHLQPPIELYVKAYLKRPKYMLWKKKDMPAVRHSKKPDADNILKNVMDALNGVAYHDDSHVSDASISKFVCAGPGFGDEKPRIEILIKEWL